MNLGKKTIGICILEGLMMVLIFAGCGNREQDKTIILPSLEYPTADTGILRIEHIQEYVGSGYSYFEEVLSASWGEPGTDILYLLKRDQDKYFYQTIDTGEDTVISSILVEERFMTNVRIASGGRYLSYEVQEGEDMALIVFSPEQETRLTLRMWENPEETFSYVWSGDGGKLFSWQNGDTGDPYGEWQVTRYEMEVDAEGVFQSREVQFQMRGNGRAWRSVLPNEDGSEVYVRDQVSVFGDSCSEGELEENGNRTDNDYVTGDGMGEGTNRTDSSYVAGSGREDGVVLGENPDNSNWLLLPDTATMVELPEYSRESVYPVRYTPAGLFVQKENGTLYLIEDIRSQPVKRELAQGNSGSFDPVPFVCVNGDHVFFMEWVDYSTYQISGIRIVGGEAESQPVVLYKESYESMVQLTVLGDQAVMFWGEEYMEGGNYRYKVIVLEY